MFSLPEFFLLFMVEEIGMLVFSIVLFNLPLKRNWGKILVISFIFVVSSWTLRMHLSPTYSVVALMAILYVLILIMFRKGLFQSLILFVTAYLSSVLTVNALIFLFTIILQISAEEIYLSKFFTVFITLLGSLITYLASFVIYKCRWAISLENIRSENLNKRTKFILGLISFICLNQILQNVSVISANEYFHKSFLLPVGVLGLAVLFFLMVHYVKSIEKQAQMREESVYLESMKRYHAELQEVSNDFFNQMGTLKQMLISYNKDAILKYIEDLLSERKFLDATLKIGEPILESFLKSKRAFCESLGIHLKVALEGEYVPPAISSVQLTRILGLVIDQVIDRQKRVTTPSTTFLNIDTMDNKVMYSFKFQNIQLSLSEDLQRKVDLYKGNISLEERGKEAIVTVSFPRS